MLRIRTEQLRVLEQSLDARFDRRLAAHLTRFFPQRCAALGAASLAAFCSRARDRAAAYGIASERDVCKFAAVTLELGPEFEALPWARAILTAPHVSGPTLRVNRLLLAAQAHARSPAP